MSYCDICKTREHVMKFRRKDGKEYHLCRDCAPMLADLLRGACAICRHAHKGDTLYCMLGKNLQVRKPDERCGSFIRYPSGDGLRKTPRDALTSAARGVQCATHISLCMAQNGRAETMVGG